MLTAPVQKSLLQAEFGAQAVSAPASHTAALAVATVWTASTTYSVGQVVMESLTNFNSGSGVVGRLFRCTTAGTSGATAPTWNATAGGTTTDGGVTWTEISTALIGTPSTYPTVTTLSGIEPGSGLGYSRATITNNTGDWTLGANAPATVTNANNIPFGVTTASWGYIVGILLFDATPTDLRSCGILSTALPVATVPGITISMPAGTLSEAMS